MDASGGWGGDKRPTKRLEIDSLEATAAARLSAYWTGYDWILGPAGWACTGEIYGDGTSTWTIAGGNRNARVVVTSTVSYGEVLEVLCHVLPKAARELSENLFEACPSAPGTLIVKAGKGALDITLPAKAPEQWWTSFLPTRGSATRRTTTATTGLTSR